MNSLFADTEEWGQVFIIDSDALIDIKLEISVAEQWNVGVDIVRAAENHKLLMPIQVHNEVVNVRHPDFPAPLASKVWSIIQGGANVRPSPRALRTVLATEPSWIGMLDSELGEIDMRFLGATLFGIDGVSQPHQEQSIQSSRLRAFACNCSAIVLEVKP